MDLQLTKKISIPHKKLGEIISDPEATAKAIKLLYVSGSEAGITRKKKGKTFTYYAKGKMVRDKEELQRIRSLVLPPAWENVWICSKANGHLQATGIDALGRKQYRYHPLWNKLRNETKFFRMHEFGKALPAIRKKIDKDLALPGMPKEKVLAAVVRLMERTSIRIGSDMYEKLYGSFGLTTLKNKHVNVKGEKVLFTFKGKKGVEHSISLKSKKLAKLVKQCLDIPGKELFQYFDENKEKRSIDSGMVNEYIRNSIEGDYTSKDFRTWSGTVQALLAFKDSGPFESATEAKKKVVEALDKVSEHLGNTRTVCKKYYVHPLLIDLYESSALTKFLDSIAIKTSKGNSPGLLPEEKLLMSILEKAGKLPRRAAA